MTAILDFEVRYVKIGDESLALGAASHLRPVQCGSDDWAVRLAFMFAPEGFAVESVHRAGPTDFGCIYRHPLAHDSTQLVVQVAGALGWRVEDFILQKDVAGGTVRAMISDAGGGFPEFDCNDAVLGLYAVTADGSHDSGAPLRMESFGSVWAALAESLEDADPWQEWQSGGGIVCLRREFSNGLYALISDANDSGVTLPYTGGPVSLGLYDEEGNDRLNVEFDALPAAKTSVREVDAKGVGKPRIVLEHKGRAYLFDGERVVVDWKEEARMSATLGDRQPRKGLTFLEDGDVLIAATEYTVVEPRAGDVLAHDWATQPEGTREPEATITVWKDGEEYARLTPFTCEGKPVFQEQDMGRFFVFDQRTPAGRLFGLMAGSFDLEGPTVRLAEWLHEFHVGEGTEFDDMNEHLLDRSQAKFVDRDEQEFDHESEMANWLRDEFVPDSAFPIDGVETDEERKAWLGRVDWATLGEWAVKEAAL